MNLLILCVGKLKDAFYKQAIVEYTKRIMPYIRIDIVEVTDEPDPQQLSLHNINLIKEKEGKKLVAFLKADDYVIALCIEGIQQSSEAFAEVFQRLQNAGTKRLVFLIGGSHGLDSDIVSKAQMKMSFSKMTFPHQLARLVLIEQVYRAQKINNNEPYHK